MESKGYAVLNTTFGMMIVQFSIGPLEFQHPEDDVVGRPGLDAFSGAVVDGTTGTLYLYGVSSNGIGVEFGS